MNTLDLTHTSSIIDISGGYISDDITARKIKIEGIVNPGPIELNVRIIEGMEKIAERGTASSDRQFALISTLAALISESPLCKA